MAQQACWHWAGASVTSHLRPALQMSAIEVPHANAQEEETPLLDKSSHTKGAR